MKLLCIVTVVTVALLEMTSGDEQEDKAKALLKQLNDDFAEFNNNLLELIWKFQTNSSDENLVALENATNFFEYNDLDLPWKDFKDYDVVRQANFFGIYKTTNTLPEDTFSELDSTISEMIDAYFSVELCGFDDKTGCNSSKIGDFDYVFSDSQNAEELLYYWTQFNDKYGKEVRPKFLKYVELGNAPSVMDGYTSKAEDWLSEFEQPSEQIEREQEEVWEAVKPLYAELHAFIRYNLNKQYGDEVVNKTGSIPAHILGSLSANDWGALFYSYEPYPEVDILVDTFIDLNDTENFSPLKLFQQTEKYYKDLSLNGMTETFWKKSLIEKPNDTDVICDSSAWDFTKGDDFRILQCTVPTFDYLITTYELMSDIEYYMSFADQPVIYRATPLSGFDSAISGAIRRSLISYKGLQNAGVIAKDAVQDKKRDINYLLYLALWYLPYMSYAHLLESWRNNVFRGKITSANLNSEFWKMRATHGISPPIPRSEDVLDAASDFVVPSDESVMDLFNYIVLKFQIYRDLCIAAGEFDQTDPDKNPLVNCEFSGNPKVGEKLSAMMKLGRSKPWYEVLKAGTGVSKFDGTAITDFFKPLFTWLQDENKKTGVTTGW